MTRRLTYTIETAAMVAVLTSLATAEEPAPTARFTDIGVSLGGAVAFADYDGDGFVDVCSGNVVHRNDQGKTFVPAATLEGAGSGFWGDFDNDGHLDLYAVGYKLFRNNQAGGFEEVDGALPELPQIRSLGAVWGDFNGDGYLDLYLGSYESWPNAYYPDALLLSDAGKTFTLKWRQEKDAIVTRGRPRPARGIIAADFDEDGDIDVYVSNYRLEPNALWLNDGNGGITDVGAERKVAGTPGHSYPFGHTIGSAWGDLDNDGHIDLFVANFRHNWGDGSQDHARFMRNRGPEFGYAFEQMGRLDGADWQESYASAAFGDYDNDGDLDLFCTTVYGGDYPRLYRNDGDWKFTNVTDEVGLASLGSTYTAAWADIDNDGDLDLATAGRIYRNHGDPNGGARNHWLKVRLEGDGDKVNRAAIGAQVRVSLGDRILMRQVQGNTGEANQNDLTLHFGLGNHGSTVPLKVTWPDGSVREEKVNPGQTVTISRNAD